MKLTKLITTSLFIASLLIIAMVRPARSNPNPTDISVMLGACGVFLGKIGHWIWVVAVVKLMLIR